jgi:SAM-dependent methyltransferase
MAHPGREQGYEGSAHLYDLFDSKRNLDFFLHYARQAGEALDIGSGTGRIAVPLARAGVRLACIEPSAAMRREFEHKLDAEPGLRGRIDLIAGRADEFDLGREFHLAMLSGCFDHFLDDEERLASLKNIARHVRRGGTLVFDAFAGIMKDSPLKPAGEVADGDLVYRREVGRRLRSDGICVVELVFEALRDDVVVDRVVEHSLVGITDRARMHEVLSEAGFKTEREFEDYDFTPYTRGDLVVIEAAKI